jgi:hypothetical protein
MSAAYFQFPLCLLSYGEHEKERLRAIIDYNVVDYAIKKLGNKKKKSLLTSAEILGVSYGDISSALPSWREARDYVERYESRHGTDALVRIGAALLWDCRKGALSYREFSILCAINSIIGRSKSPKRVTQPAVRVRAAGYKSWSVATAEAATAKLYSEDQIYRTLNRLEKRGFFARARTGKTTVLFLNGANYEELKDKILELEKKKAGIAGRAHKDRQLRAQIKAIRSTADINKAADVNSTADINTGINTEPDHSKTVKNRGDTADSCAVETAVVAADINNSSLIEAFNKSLPNESVHNSACAHDFSDFQKNEEKKKEEAVLEEKEVRYKLKGGTKIFSQVEANRLFAGNSALEFEML